MQHSTAHWNLGADPGYGHGGDPASEAKSCRHSGTELCEQSGLSAARVQDQLNGPGNFWIFIAQICILPHSRILFLSFLTSTSIIKADKNRTLDCTLINLRYFYILHPFFNLHEKVIPLIV